MISKAATLVFALAASLPFVSAQCSRSYTVKAGDTCDGISSSQSVSTYQLATNNPSINSGCTNLQVGQTLCLGTQGEDCTDTLVIEEGDTCDELIECAGINGTMFFHNNPTINDECTNLYVGQVVCVASEVLVPPMGAAEPSSAPSGSSAPPASSAPAAPVNVAPSPSVHSSSASPAPTPSPTVHSSAPSSSPSDDGDDGDLPFCDELEDEDEEDN